MTTPTAAEPAEPRYTQGIMSDGAAILDDGVLLTVEQILDRLNTAAMVPSAPDDIVALVDDLQGAQHVLSTCERMYVTGFKDRRNLARTALLTAIGRMGRGTASELANRDVFNGLHVEMLVREWFSTPLAATLSPHLIDGLIDVLRMRLSRAAPPPPPAGEPVEPSPDALREALEPFARYASHPAFAMYEAAPDNTVLWSIANDPGEGGVCARITYGDLRRAALASAQPRPEVTEATLRKPPEPVEPTRTAGDEVRR